MIETSGMSEAIRMVTALARLFHQPEQGAERHFTLNRAQHAKSYLTIQEMRYKNKSAVEMDCTGHAGTLFPLLLAIQPLLENAIYHGMEYMDGDGPHHPHPPSGRRAAH